MRRKERERYKNKEYETTEREIMNRFCTCESNDASEFRLLAKWVGVNSFGLSVLVLLSELLLLLCGLLLVLPVLLFVTLLSVLLILLIPLTVLVAKLERRGRTVIRLISSEISVSEPL
jgi:hypothetical protein